MNGRTEFDLQQFRIPTASIRTFLTTPNCQTLPYSRNNNKKHVRSAVIPVFGSLSVRSAHGSAFCVPFLAVFPQISFPAIRWCKFSISSVRENCISFSFHISVCIFSCCFTWFPFHTRESAANQLRFWCVCFRFRKGATMSDDEGTSIGPTKV